MNGLLWLLIGIGIGWLISSVLNELRMQALNKAVVDTLMDMRAEYERRCCE